MSEVALKTIARRLATARHVVAFTGAGMSTESGIPDFRSPGGIWSSSQPVYYDQFLSSAAARHEYWRQKAIAHRDFASSQPNAGHLQLANWEASGHLQAVITQNIDGLHQLAGSGEVVELHGTARQVMCLECGERFPADPWVDAFLQTDEVPTCPVCRSPLMKHATISFGQPLDEATVARARQWCGSCDLMLVMGSSLVVEPAASLPLLACGHGARLVIINRDPTPHDQRADQVIHAGIGATLTAIDGWLRSADETGPAAAGAGS